MRKLILATVLFVAVSIGNATIVTITCQNGVSHFLPVTVNANCGDTIRWTYVSGVHIVGPVTAADIPVGASMWVGNIDANNLSYDYVVTVAGNYHYVCHPATPHGEDGYIVVSCPSSVQHIAPGSFSFAFPNPFTNRITIESPGAERIVIYDLLGKALTSYSFKNGQFAFTIDLATLPKGMYFYSIIMDGIVMETRKIIKE